jgi:hypothetical protein
VGVWPYLKFVEALHLEILSSLTKRDCTKKKYIFSTYLHPILAFCLGLCCGSAILSTTANLMGEMINMLRTAEGR